MAALNEASLKEKLRDDPSAFTLSTAKATSKKFIPTE